jgi:hypothetical protein
MCQFKKSAYFIAINVKKSD